MCVHVHVYQGTHRVGMVNIHRTASGNPSGANGLGATLRRQDGTSSTSTGSPTPLPPRVMSMCAGTGAAVAAAAGAGASPAAARHKDKIPKAIERLSLGELAPPAAPVSLGPEVVDRVSHASKVRRDR
jgi:hypothetical protein